MAYSHDENPHEEEPFVRKLFSESFIRESPSDDFDRMLMDRVMYDWVSNAGSRESLVDKKNRLWQIAAWILIFSGTVLPIITYVNGHLTFVSAAPLFGGLYCLRMCDKIKF